MKKIKCKRCGAWLFSANYCDVEIHCKNCGYINKFYEPPQYKPEREKAIIPDYETRRISDIIRSHSTQLKRIS